MINGSKLDSEARTLAKDIDEADINDIEKQKDLLAQAERIRKEFVQWVSENSASAYDAAQT